MFLGYFYGRPQVKSWIISEEDLMYTTTGGKETVASVSVIMQKSIVQQKDTLELVHLTKNKKFKSMFMNYKKYMETNMIMESTDFGLE